MNTLNIITNSVMQSINETIIDDLLKLDFSHDEAVMLVTEYDGFDIGIDAEENPVLDF